MSQDTPSSAGLNIPPVAPVAAGQPEEQLERVFLVSYPKIVFLYPTYIVSIIAWLVMLLLGDAAMPDGTRHRVAELITLFFLMLTAANLVVISFDFPRTTSLTLFFAFSAVLMGAVLLFTNHPDLVKPVSQFLESLSSKTQRVLVGVPSCAQA